MAHVPGSSLIPRQVASGIAAVTDVVGIDVGEYLEERTHERDATKATTLLPIMYITFWLLHLSIVLRHAPSRTLRLNDLVKHPNAIRVSPADQTVREFSRNTIRPNPPCGWPSNR